jgi:hypothetical protein
VHKELEDRAKNKDKRFFNFSKVEKQMRKTKTERKK